MANNSENGGRKGTNSINAKKGTSPLHFLIEATSGGP